MRFPRDPPEPTGGGHHETVRHEAGFIWAGALALGMGGAVGGKPLDKAGGMVRNVVKALDAATASLAAGGLIPEEATALAGKPMMARCDLSAIRQFRHEEPGPQERRGQADSRSALRLKRRHNTSFLIINYG